MALPWSSLEEDEVHLPVIELFSRTHSTLTSPSGKLLCLGNVETTLTIISEFVRQL